MTSESGSLERDVEAQVWRRTSGRVRDLVIEVGSTQVVLRGRAASFHVKQLAQHGVRDVLPDVQLENAIVVERNRPVPSA